MDNTAYKKMTRIDNVLECFLDKRDNSYKFKLDGREDVYTICPKCLTGRLLNSFYTCTSTSNEEDSFSVNLTSCSNFKYCEFITFENVVPKMENKFVQAKIDALKKRKKTNEEKKREIQELRESLQHSSFSDILKELAWKSPLKLTGSFLIVAIVCAFLFNTFAGNVTQSIKASMFGMEVEMTSDLD
jgi:hypothetical protein